MILIYALIILAAFVGIIITLTIYKDKHKKQPLVCPFGADCHSVVTSDFSTFFGIGLELYGAMYYGLIALTYIALILFPALVTPWTMFIITGATIGAFLFSLYLTFVQAFYLKSWCSWCLMSAGVSTVIFIFTLIELTMLDFSIVPILAFLYLPILWLHMLGFALGIGGATITDVLFFKFLNDFQISKEEHNTLQILSQVIWVGLVIVIISGIGLYLPNAEILNQTPKFLVKAIVVAVIIINGAFLNLYISPKLVHMSWQQTAIPVKRATRLRRIAFALGGISFTSWYGAFILGFLKDVSLSFQTLLSVYIVVVALMIIASQIAERLFSKTASTARN